MTRVIHWNQARAVDGEVYIGRMAGAAGYFGSPIRLGSVCVVCAKRHNDAGSTLDCFEQWARTRLMTDPTYRENVKDLHGKTLVCWCAPGPCHGDVLAKLSAELNRSGS